MLPALHLKTDALGAPVLKHWDSDLRAATRESKNQYTSLEAARGTVTPYSDANWELGSWAGREGAHQSFDQEDLNSPFNRGQMGGQANQAPDGWFANGQRFWPTRHEFKYLRKMYVTNTQEEDDTAKYAYDTPGLGMMNQYQQLLNYGNFDVADLTNGSPALIKWWSCPCELANMAANNPVPMAQGPVPAADAPPPLDWATIRGPSLFPMGAAAGAGTKIKYIMVAAIDLINKQTRLCGSALYYDDAAVPVETDGALMHVIASCPYYRIGEEFSGAPGSRAARRYQEAGMEGVSQPRRR